MRVGVRAGLAVLMLVAALAALVGLPSAAAAAPTDEPPDMIGKTVGEAQLALREQWYPVIEFVLTPAGGRLPAGADQSLAVVQKQVLRNPGWSGANAQFVGTGPRRPIVEFQVVPRVPDIVGLTRVSADRLLTVYGLAARFAPASVGPQWPVARQDPLPGAPASFGDVVVAVMREPSTARLVRVPDIRGRTVSAATTVVNAADLVLDVEQTGPGEAGPVVGQRPIPGTLVAPGTQVVAVVRPVSAAPSLPPSAGDGGGRQPPWVLIAAVSGGSLLLLLLLLALLLHRRRRPAGPARAPDHVAPVPRITAEPRVGAIVGPTFEPLGPAPTHSIRIQPRAAAGPAYFEEVPR